MKLYSRNFHLDLSFPHVMGILNVTPDSFFDGGIHKTLSDILVHTNNMVNAGATIIDIGGESTRPGANTISVSQELERIIPTLEAIADRFEVWISVDTSQPEVIRESARAGAYMINDIRSLSKPGALEAAAETGLPICLMHMPCTKPHVTQEILPHDDIVSVVDTYFADQIARCETALIKKENLVFDPGFGFGKTLRQNYKLLAYLNHFHHFKLPILVGLSRKSMIGNILNVEVAQRLIGSISCAVIAAIQGAHIIRVHDVKETVEAIRIFEAMKRAKE
ncbi:dihydropteroate synthase [Candidatus Pantoea carbekii]|uniref:Dihydropteroate synthase n=1 Tax=Candidatus Pantoea carbekii TaxID=1235990 RepID=U3U610_9GAMM|nr:dihydropteroate synthase [Candidatus Pantoea carbekii]AKC32600.1 dihydropteroate synthase FolP [Candidatus Pantoea carbekii]BAO00340.1 FolP protein [Candidatus Pantoea carbekii]